MNYLLFSFLKTLYFCYNSMVFLSIYNILYTIGKLWFPSFQWDCCQSEILTYSLSSQLSIQISYLSPVQLVLFKILEYSRQCKIPHSKAYALLLRTDNQESCSATLGPHLSLLDAIYICPNLCLHYTISVRQLRLFCHSLMAPRLGCLTLLGRHIGTATGTIY